MLRDGHAPGYRFFRIFPDFPRFSQLQVFQFVPEGEEPQDHLLFSKTTSTQQFSPALPYRLSIFFNFILFSLVICFLFLPFLFCFSIFCSFIRLNRGVHDKKGNQASNVSPNFFSSIQGVGEVGYLDSTCIRDIATSEKCSQVINHKKEKIAHIMLTNESITTKLTFQGLENH